MRRAGKHRALERRVCLGACLALFAMRCDADDYPLTPTFCDDWCRVIRRVPCDQEPENCVRSCERARGPSECQAAYGVLLDCYTATPASEFSCSDEGFNQVARPREHICRAERDALIECAYPNVRVCLDVCRTLEAAHQQDAGGGSSRVRCPSRDIPCDSLCWYVTREITAISRDGGVFTDVASALITCAIARAEACRAVARGDALDGSADASDAVAPANWSSVLLRCAGQVRSGGGEVP